VTIAIDRNAKVMKNPAELGKKQTAIVFTESEMLVVDE